MLIKYKNIEDLREISYIEAIEHQHPAEVIQLLQQIDHICLNNEWYRYVYSNYKPAIGEGEVDELYVYVDLIKYSDALYNSVDTIFKALSNDNEYLN